jgi:hypothetical protein
MNIFWENYYILTWASYETVISSVPLHIMNQDYISLANLKAHPWY